MKLFLGVLLFLVLIPAALADEYSFKMGLGIIEKPTSTIKTFALRNEGRVLAMVHDAVEFGLWTDTGKAQNRKPAGYAEYQVGVRPQSDNFYAKAYVGGSLISSTDSQLGGIFQFAETIGIGFQDKSSFVGVNYDHKSSAGMFKPNKGRDFISGEIGVRF